MKEDMGFMFEWQKQYFTSEHGEQVRYCTINFMKIILWAPPDIGW